MTNRRVVITGMGAVTPFGLGVNKFWNSLLEGKSGVSRIDYLSMEGHLVTFAAQVKEEDLTLKNCSGLKKQKEWTDIRSLQWLLQKKPLRIQA